MYEQYLNLNSRPFMSTPFVDHYFPGQAIQKSLSSARICIDRGTGPVLIVGAAGTGKSLLLAMLNEQYRSQFQVVNLSCSATDRRQEFLQHILFELQLPFRGLSEGELRLGLMDFLRSSSSCPNGLLLLIDEANNLNTELLDEVRLISNFVRDGQPRARLVMAGNMRLEESLNDPRLQSLNQRISARCYLGNLSKAETAEYVLMHIDRAGGDGKQLFSAESLDSIHQLTEGCPRFINQLCDHSLILAVTNGKHHIDLSIIRESWNDLQCFPDVFGDSSETSLFNDRDKVQSGSAGEWSVIEFGSLDDNESSSNCPESHETAGYSSESSTSGWECSDSQASSAAFSWQQSAEFGQQEFANSTVDCSPGQFTQTENSEPVKPKYFAANPFSETFESVEEVFDRYAPLVADFNRSSLEVTAQDLSCLDSIALSDSYAPSESFESEPTPRSPVADSVATCSPSLHQHQDEPSSSQIAEEAGALLQRLSDTFGGQYDSFDMEPAVSHETENTIEERTSIKIRPMIGDPSPITFVNQNESRSNSELSQLESLKQVIEEQNRFSAQAFSRVAIETGSAAPQSKWNIQPAVMADISLSAPSNMSIGSNTRDDQDILVREPSELPFVAPQANESPDRIKFSPTPVSTGRAERIDYQQLFDRLRNLPEK